MSDTSYVGNGPTKTQIEERHRMFEINSCKVTIEKGNILVSSDRKIAYNDAARKGGDVREVNVTINYTAFVGGNIPNTRGMATVLARSFNTDWIAYQNILREKEWGAFSDGDMLTYDPASRESRAKKSTGDKLRALVAKKRNIPVGDVTTEMILAELDS